MPEPRHGDAGVDECPECGGAMRRRENRQTGEPFWGCAQYPNCKGTRPLSGAAERHEPELPSDRYRRNDRRRWDQ